MSKTHYDSIAHEYQDSKMLPFRRHIEEFTIFELMGDLRGKEALDLACGEGIYSRSLIAHGAKRVVGVDLSAGMIALAQERQRQHPSPIEYRVGDAMKLAAIGAFDVVLGSYLLNYARTKEELLQFCRSIALNLKPGGRFIGYNDNVANEMEYYPSYRKYGFVKSGRVPRSEGDPITYTFCNLDGTEFLIENYYLAPATYEAAFRESGFRSFKWHPPRLSAEGRESYPRGFWDDYLTHPPMVGIEARA
jgi:ubiquinone/menaquinone biosynthesis C-methylase UbiE